MGEGNQDREDKAGCLPNLSVGFHGNWKMGKGIDLSVLSHEESEHLKHKDLKIQNADFKSARSCCW